MEPHAMLKADPLDILFENRNKLYGACPLRKFYAQRLYISLGITISAVVLSSFIYQHFQTLPAFTKKPDVRDVYIGTYQFPPPEKPILPHARPTTPKLPASLQLVTLVIVPDKKIPEPLPTIDELKTSVIGLKTSSGVPDNDEPHNNGISATGTTAQNREPVENKPEIFERAEVMSEFPGGIEALKRFLLKNLRMPENNLETGTEVRVMARFVAVAVYFNLPVNFVSVE